MAGSYWKEGQYSIVGGEALTLFEAIKAMEQRGFTHMIFEMDSKSVADAIHNIHGFWKNFEKIFVPIYKSLYITSETFNAIFPIIPLLIYYYLFFQYFKLFFFIS
jgi:hypothetical protein